MKKAALFLSLCLIFTAAVPAMAGEITVGGNMTYNMYLPSGADVAGISSLEPWFYSTYTLDITGSVSGTTSALVEFRYANNLPVGQVVPQPDLLSKYYLKWTPEGASFYFGKNFYSGNRFKILNSGITNLQHEGIAVQTTDLGGFTGTLLFNPNFRGFWLDDSTWADYTPDLDFLAAAQADFRVPFGELGLNLVSGLDPLTWDKAYAFSVEAAIPIPVTPVTLVMEVGSSTAQNASVAALLGLHADIRGTMVFLEGAAYQDGKVVEYGTGISRSFDGLEAKLQYQGTSDSTNGSQVVNGRLTGELKVEF